MTNNNGSDRNISKLTKAAGEIAFQADLFTLGASIELACAGDDRKGFGVVADEVRDLARFGALAAKASPLAKQERTF